jgi:Neuraminidase (sialidase)
MKSQLRRPFLLTLALFFVVLPSLQARAKKASLPEQFQTAKTAFVETRDGDITNLHLDPEDRNAILDTQEGIEAWGRYDLSRSRHDADLIFVVTKGRVPRDSPSPILPSNSRNTPGRSTSPDTGDASQRTPNDPGSDGFKDEKDRLDVFILQPNNKLKGPIWSGQMPRGLDSPGRLLLQRLKSEVDKTYPQKPTNTP